LYGFPLSEHFIWKNKFVFLKFARKKANVIKAVMFSSLKNEIYEFNGVAL